MPHLQQQNARFVIVMNLAEIYGNFLVSVVGLDDPESFLTVTPYDGSVCLF